MSSKILDGSFLPFDSAQADTEIICRKDTKTQNFRQMPSPDCSGNPFLLVPFDFDKGDNKR